MYIFFPVHHATKRRNVLTVSQWLSQFSTVEKNQSEVTLWWTCEVIVTLCWQCAWAVGPITICNTSSDTIYQCGHATWWWLQKQIFIQYYRQTVEDGSLYVRVWRQFEQADSGYIMCKGGWLFISVTVMITAKDLAKSVSNDLVVCSKFSTSLKVCIWTSKQISKCQFLLVSS